MITYEIEGRILIIRQNGEVEPKAFAAVIATAFKDENFKKKSFLLWDATDSPSTITASKMQKMLVGLERVSNHIEQRCAILVESSLQFGVSRMLTTYSGFVGIEAKAFFDEEIATAWLLNPQSGCGA